MQKKAQIVWTAAAVAGIAVMGVAGWWVGGKAVAKPELAADAHPEAAVVPVADAGPVVGEANPAVPEAIPTAVGNSILVLDGRAVQPSQITIQRDPATGQMRISSINGTAGDAGARSGAVRVLPVQNVPGDVGRIGVQVDGAGQRVVGQRVVVRDGTRANGTATVNVNGTITTFTITGDGHAVRATGPGNLVIQGNAIVIGDGQAGPAVEQGPKPVANPAGMP